MSVPIVTLGGRGAEEQVVVERFSTQQSDAVPQRKTGTSRTPDSGPQGTGGFGFGFDSGLAGEAFSIDHLLNLLHVTLGVIHVDHCPSADINDLPEDRVLRATAS